MDSALSPRVITYKLELSAGVKSNYVLGRILIVDVTLDAI
jgi:hypothetical protein